MWRLLKISFWVVVVILFLLFLLGNGDTSAQEGELSKGRLLILEIFPWVLLVVAFFVIKWIAGIGNGGKK